MRGQREGKLLIDSSGLELKYFEDQEHDNSLFREASFVHGLASRKTLLWAETLLRFLDKKADR